MNPSEALETIILYHGAITIVFDPMKHLYTLDGVPVPGVTGVIGMINKPALIPWAANMAAQRMGELLKPGVAYDEVQIKEMLGEAKVAHRRKKEAAGDVGTLIHKWIERWIKGENPEPPVNEVMKYATGKFLEWQKQYDVKFVFSERRIYSKKYHYAGTCDFVGTIGGKRIVGDIKTNSAVYPEMWFQTAAYQQALSEEFPEDEYEGTVIIRCGKDGSFEISETLHGDFKKNIKAFLGALALYNRMADIKTAILKKMI